ncbi:CpaD family pilus assembly protein [Allomesorhizobium alhagi]|jgi:pilus assembly protein CpaD|uniref:Pilus assembly protein cpaD n=1 Tax=Mesorhizobium alhagi CCNWXJ12-2 TaxID=1107882 RepID=H0HJS9_9HYPH|nr:CpaD family pilus assembly protein [Mesorhizobium alhagi]EHK58992.1 pilus assembly protein cpaD [Mesorhizobium alhagi CCNWXJ12-2]
MSKAAFKNRTDAARKGVSPTRIRRPAVSILGVAALALLAGCAMGQRDSVVVGSIPDDYRTNHPIVIAEKDQVIDLPVAASDRGMTAGQRASLEGFFADYDRSAAPPVSILVPVGAANDIAASHAGNDFARLAKANGIPDSRILISSYQAPSPEISAPVRVAYTAMKAQTGKCGRWPEDILESTENKHYANFGCSYQNNLAAQIANPSDLLGPRKQTTIDAERRGIVIDDYRNAPVFAPPQRREVEY